MAHVDSGAMTPHRFHILVALAGEAMHGSGIVRDVADRTEGEVRLWPATLYGTLEALEADGLIEELVGAERPEGVSERRRYYRITPLGRRALTAEATRMDALAKSAVERLRNA